MAKHHHQSRSEQRANKEHGIAPFHQERIPKQERVIINATINQISTPVEDISVENRLYLMYQKIGVFNLANVLVGERIIKDHDPQV